MTKKLLDHKQFIPNFLIPKLSRSIHDFPGLTVLLAVLTTVLPMALSHDLQVFSMLLPVLLTLSVWYIKGVRTAFFLAALPATAGLAAVFFHLTPAVWATLCA